MVICNNQRLNKDQMFIKRSGWINYGTSIQYKSAIQGTGCYSKYVNTEKVPCRVTNMPSLTEKDRGSEGEKSSVLISL